MSTELQAAIDAARQAGALLLKHFRTNLEVKHKDGEFDPVTQADSEADDLLRSIISEQFPDDSLLSEENPARPGPYTGRTWMIDPLDGTKDFIHGRDTFSVIIGLLTGDEPSMGVVFLPAKNELYYAQKGAGAHRVSAGQTQKIHVSTVTEIGEARMFARIPTSEPRALDMPVRQLRVKERILGGSVGSRLCAIASDQADLFVNTHHRVSKWDTLGPQMILAEAGGAIMTLNQAQLDYTQTEDRWRDPFVAASTGRLAVETVKQLGVTRF